MKFLSRISLGDKVAAVISMIALFGLFKNYETVRAYVFYLVFHDLISNGAAIAVIAGVLWFLKDRIVDYIRKY